MSIKKTFYLLIILSFVFCKQGNSQSLNNKITKQTDLTNQKIKDYDFLACMYRDSYFPVFLVDKCKVILLNLCGGIEEHKPKTLGELYKLTHAATNQLNDLQTEFFKHDSEIETGARECLGINFEYIANAYGFKADIEELIATRDW